MRTFFSVEASPMLGRGPPARCRVTRAERADRERRVGVGGCAARSDGPLGLRPVPIPGSHSAGPREWRCAERSPRPPEPTATPRRSTTEPVRLRCQRPWGPVERPEPLARVSESVRVRPGRARRRRHAVSTRRRPRSEERVLEVPQAVSNPRLELNIEALEQLPLVDSTSGGNLGDGLTSSHQVPLEVEAQT